MSYSNITPTGGPLTLTGSTITGPPPQNNYSLLQASNTDTRKSTNSTP